MSVKAQAASVLNNFRLFQLNYRIKYNNIYIKNRLNFDRLINSTTNIKPSIGFFFIIFPNILATSNFTFNKLI